MLETNLRWHWIVGGLVVGGFAVALGWLWNVNLPEKLRTAQDAAISKTREEMTNQLDPIKQQLAILVARQELNSPSGPRKLPELFKQKSLGWGKEGELDLLSVGALAGEARTREIRVEPKVVASVGMQLLSIEEAPQASGSGGPAVREPPRDAAWTAAQALAAYRSFLNRSLAPNLGEARPLPGDSGEWRVRFPLENKTGAPQEFKYSIGKKLVSAAEAARSEPIGSAWNNDQKFGPAFLVMETRASVVLDNMTMKNVVIKNATVVHRGGPIDLDNVFFIDCDFRVERTEVGRRLLARVLTETSTTVKPT